MRRVAEGDEAVERVASELQRRPAVALVAALPQLAIGEAGEQSSVRREKRVGHRGKRLRQAAGERLP